MRTHRLAGGGPHELISEAGFKFIGVDRGYASGPKVLAYLYKGLARRRD